MSQGSEPRDPSSLATLVAASDVSPRVVSAFRAIDRAMFVPADVPNPYIDKPIEIIEHQTTSQPSLIAQMIDAADVLPGDRVLEVGTGFGYQTALLAHLTDGVVSIDRHATITDVARGNLERAGLSAELVVGDGWQGVVHAAPFDAIVVSAAASMVPEALAEQLAPGGRLVIPLRTDDGDDVFLFVKDHDHLVKVRLLTPARFVPLVPGS